MIIQVVVGGLFLLRIGWLCWRAVTGGGRQSRLGWLQAAGEVLLMMLIARLLLNWSIIPPLLWLLPVVISAATAVAVLRRWPKLPWVPSGRRLSAGIAWTVVGGVLVAGCAGVLLA